MPLCSGLSTGLPWRRCNRRCSAPPSGGARGYSSGSCPSAASSTALHVNGSICGLSSYRHRWAARLRSITRACRRRHQNRAVGAPQWHLRLQAGQSRAAKKAFCVSTPAAAATALAEDRHARLQWQVKGQHRTAGSDIWAQNPQWHPLCCGACSDGADFALA